MFITLAIFMALIIGIFCGYNLESMYPKIHGGEPREGLPPVGSAIHVEYFATDGTFVGVHSGERLYYKPVMTSSKTKIILEAGGVYEVVDQKLQIAGGHQKMLVRINK